MLVDGMNLAWKSIHSHDLQTSFGIDTSAVYGFMNQLSYVLNPRDVICVVVWDGGYAERTEWSKAGIKRGIIKKAYKETRGKKPKDDKICTINDQTKIIRDFLKTTDVKQILIEDYEADDVVASMCERVRGKMEVVCFTCDHDYYQLLEPGVTVLSRLKGEEKVTHSRLVRNSTSCRAEEVGGVSAL